MITRHGHNFNSAFYLENGFRVRHVLRENIYKLTIDGICICLLANVQLDEFQE